MARIGMRDGERSGINQVIKDKYTAASDGKSFMSISHPEGFWEGDSIKMIKMFKDGNKNGVYKTKKGKHTVVFNLKEPKVKKSSKIAKSSKKNANNVKKLLPIMDELMKARMELGMSVIDVAKKMGKFSSQVYGLESGKTQYPAIKSLESYAKAVGKSILITLAPSKTS